MLYRRFGRTELPMPVLSCGGMRFQQSWSADDPVTPESQTQLQRVVDGALERGVYHFETARGYGTSEAQLGEALEPHPRDSYILQTKIRPRPDPAVFREQLEASFVRLRTSRIDLLGIHGINTEADFIATMKPGGCWDIANAYRQRGAIGAIGFSTHAECDLIREAIATDKFDYVNLHWYFIFQENRQAIDDAAAHDMGVFIISPTDKGGHLHTPRDVFRTLCEPLHPLQFNDRFCLRNTNVHTLSVGAARPEHFDLHIDALTGAAREPSIEAIEEALTQRFVATMDGHHPSTWLDGLPSYRTLPDGANVRAALWLYGLTVAWDLGPFARSRYNMLTGDDDWCAGRKPALTEPARLRAALKMHGLSSERTEWAMALVDQSHALLHEPP